MMTKMRMLAAGAAAVIALGVGAGLAGAAQTDATTTPPTTVDMDAMHEQMRTSMPEDVQAQCDAMHASMQGHMVGGMGAGRMMSGR